MNPRVTLAVAVRVWTQLRRDHRTLAMLRLLPCILEVLLWWIFDAQPLVFDRIGPASNLIQQHQGPFVRLIQYATQHAHVRAEGGETGRDGLAVSNVGVELPKDREPAQHRLLRLT